MSQRSVRSSGILLALLCGYNVLLHAIGASDGWSWFESRGLILWPTTEVYRMINHSSFWALYWFVGLLLAINLWFQCRTGRARDMASILVGMTLLDVTLHGAHLHASIEYTLISRDVFWALYWVAASFLCLRLVIPLPAPSLATHPR